MSVIARVSINYQFDRIENHLGDSPLSMPTGDYLSVLTEARGLAHHGRHFSLAGILNHIKWRKQAKL